MVGRPQSFIDRLHSNNTSSNEHICEIELTIDENWVRGKLTSLLKRKSLSHQNNTIWYLRINWTRGFATWFNITYIFFWPMYQSEYWIYSFCHVPETWYPLSTYLFGSNNKFSLPKWKRAKIGNNRIRNMIWQHRQRLLQKIIFNVQTTYLLILFPNLNSQL